MKELFQDRNYALLFTGNFVSEMGNVLFSFVAGLYVQEITGGSAILLALFISLGAFVRLLLSPIAGVLVDRWNKVKIIYITDFIRGVLFVVIGYVFFIGVVNNQAIIILLTVTVISGIISAFFGPAVTAATPEIVGLNKVQQANGANSIIQSITMIMGVVLGAAAFGLFDFYIAVLLNGLSFILSGFSEMFIKALHKEEIPEHEPPHILQDIKFGFGYIRKKDGLLRMMTYSLLMNFSFTPLFYIGIPYLFKTELEKGPWDIAFVNIAFGISMMFAGVIVGSVAIKSMTKTIRVSLIYTTLSIVFIALNIYLLSYEIISYPIFYGIMILCHILLATFVMITNVPLNTSLVKVVDAQVRGKVFSTLGSLSQAAVPIAIFMGGAIIALSNVAFLGVVCSILLLVPTLGFLLDSKVSNLLQGIEREANDIDQELKSS